MTYAMIILLTGYTMSYDLHFKGRDSQAKFKLESVRGFLTSGRTTSSQMRRQSI